MLQRGAKINVQTDLGYTALRCAVPNGHADVVRCLLQRGAEVNTQDDPGNTALIYAVSNGHVDVVRCLLRTGATANAQDDSGNTAPLLAVCWANETHSAEEVKLLIERGADTCIRNKNGNVAKGWAMLGTELWKILERAESRAAIENPAAGRKRSSQSKKLGDMFF